MQPLIFEFEGKHEFKTMILFARLHQGFLVYLCKVYLNVFKILKVISISQTRTYLST